MCRQNLTIKAKTMKTVRIYFQILVALLLTNISDAQTINWAKLSHEEKHIINGHVGLEHGVIYGIGYGYQLKNRWFPVVLGAEYSFPSGKQIVDDFKTKIGGQIRLIGYRNIHFSARVQGIFRRYENDFARMLNFGCDISGVVGYYRPKWFVAGEVGFDKAIVTHFKHSDLYKGQYPQVEDGWYEPATGGNFYYGLQAGYSFRKQDIYLRAGRIITQDFRTEPLIPYYGQLGVSWRF